MVSQAEDGLVSLDHTVGHLSRKLLPIWRIGTVMEKECLDIRLAVEAFRVYLLGRPFFISKRTMHRSVARSG